MLTKNVYILYPAGYSGNFMSWAISASDVDLAKTTVTSPVYTGPDTKKYGGFGTSHLHHRTPTHQNIWQHLPWMILNQPKENKIYVINSCNLNISATINSILLYDPDPTFIVIHDNNDADIRSYGQINCAIKWPAFLSASFAYRGIKCSFDPFNCKDDIHFRNLVATKKSGLQGLDPINSQLEKIKSEFDNNNNWYHTRHAATPHEVNEDYYLKRNVFPIDSIFELTCLDIVSDQFIDILNSIFEKSQCSSKYSLGTVIDAHKEYVQVQKNLEWFDAIKEWRQFGTLSPYMYQHAVIQGQVLFHILTSCQLIDPDTGVEVDLQDHTQWKLFYNCVKDISWPQCNNEQDFCMLPDHIKKEIVEVHNYVPKYSQDKSRTECRLALLNWKKMSLDSINDIYQSYKKYFTTVSNVS